jgi:hypothetical protein
MQKWGGQDKFLFRFAPTTGRPYAVEKLDISEIEPNLGDRKCLGDSRRSFIEHPGAILFSANFSE